MTALLSLGVSAVACVLAVCAALWARRARRGAQASADRLRAAVVAARGRADVLVGLPARQVALPVLARPLLHERDPLLDPSPPDVPSNGQPLLAPVRELRAGWLAIRWIEGDHGVSGYQWECTGCTAVGNITPPMIRVPPWRWHRHFTRERLEGAPS